MPSAESSAHAAARVPITPLGVIPNPNEPSYLPDVEFSPDGRVFAVTTRDEDCVRIYRSDTRDLLKELKGCDILSSPHGLAMTDTHLVVSSKGASSVSATFISSFEIYGDRREPCSVQAKPRPDLYEPHSIALYREQMFVTYCGGRTQGLAVYGWDPETGQIGACERLVESCFTGYGHPKGVAVDHRFQRLFVSFVQEKRVPIKRSNWRQKLRREWSLTEEKVRRTWSLSENKLAFAREMALGARELASRVPWPTGGSGGEEGVRNGVMVFDLREPRFNETPIRVLESDRYTRFENIDIHGHFLAIADPLNNTVAVYSLEKPDLSEPLLSISEHLCFPHDVALSPLGDQMIVSNYGIRTHEDEVLWQVFEEKRSDRLVLYDCQTVLSAARCQ
jgi:hypothetical protein